MSDSCLRTTLPALLSGTDEQGQASGDTVDQMGTRDWRSEADRLAGQYIPHGDPTGWFEQLWRRGRDGAVTMPWDSGRAHPLLAEWLDGRRADPGRRGVVVGCGLGADAELVAASGFDTVAFDVSPTAVELARQRHPTSTVTYAVADLFSLPGRWLRSFDLVVDVFTVQALPVEVRPEATAAVAELVAPGGSLLLVSFAQPGEQRGEGPPWPLSSDDIGAFALRGLDAVETERLPPVEGDGPDYWRAEFSRPA